MKKDLQIFLPKLGNSDYDKLYDNYIYLNNA